jgi:hypothetical protein
MDCRSTQIQITKSLSTSSPDDNSLKLREKIKISGITAVERDKPYDDETLRNAGSG